MDEINFESELDFLTELDEPMQSEAINELPAAEEAIPAALEEDLGAQVEPSPEELAAIEPKKAKHAGKSSKKRSFLPKLAKKDAPKDAAPQPAEAVESNVPAATANPRRRPKLTKMEIFKQTTLPLIILAVAALLIVVFIIGSITRAVQKNHTEKEASIAVSESIAEEQARLEAEMNSILEKAERMAAGYDFDGAVALIDTFSGNIGGYPKLQDARARYEYSKESLVPWEDPNTIINLSFHLLLNDTERAYSNEEYGSSIKKNFMTVGEFQKILERLYENDYVLVNLSDIVETTTSESGAVTTTYKQILMPEGKKPFVMTQTNVNYSLYLVDSDDDLVADRGGLGVASKLVLDAEGNVVAEYINADGSVSTGAYDLVPILDEFVEKHPDFSYHGAKAVLALTGYNGLFGYRTHPSARAVLGEEQYEKDVASVQAIANALKESGYELACYTYANNAYGRHSLSQIQSDMNKWMDEVTPILGNLDTFVFAQDSDIGDGMLYSGSKFDYLKSLGFKYFLGYCSEGNPFTVIAEDYVRQGRLLVSGSHINNQPKWFNDIFDTTDLLDPARTGK